MDADPLNPPMPALSQSPTLLPQDAPDGTLGVIEDNPHTGDSGAASRHYAQSHSQSQSMDQSLSDSPRYGYGTADDSESNGHGSASAGGAYPDHASRGSGAHAEPNNGRNHVVIKVGMVGDAQIGKTSLMVNIRNTEITFSIWDLGGQREFVNMLPLVCNDAVAILFMFDLTRKSTLNSIKEWYRQGRGFNKTAIPILVGTKYDHFVNFPREDQEEISNQARRFAKAMRAALIFSSTSHSNNVQKIFKIVLSKAFDLKCTIPEIENFARVRHRGRQQPRRRNKLMKQRKQKMPMSEPATLATHPSRMLLASSETAAARPEWNSWADAIGIESGLWRRRRHAFSYDGSDDRPETELIAPTPWRPICLYLPAVVGTDGVGYLEAQASSCPASTATHVDEASASQGSSVYYSVFSSPRSPEERTPTGTPPTKIRDRGFLDAVLAAANIPLASGPLSHIPSRLSQESNDTVVRVRPLRVEDYASDATPGKDNQDNEEGVT
ncbi:GTP-binding protein [Grosmannia clavigera kw1407]|uniref:GTP-binding protein n=1 Tax=Grosmannia clavigera (strain kw1407 / UAMH 11150) TaxID=655863 RepID=F0XNY4_GROCL|nr:GTP-binding protein [Grosmannia clavigera kw1407]EFX00197.1 GTP-binding protein [Grosmannia clavigera kw1407]